MTRRRRVPCYLVSMAAELETAGVLPSAAEFLTSTGCTGTADRVITWNDCPPGHEHPVCTPCRDTVAADGALGTVDRPMGPAPSSTHRTWAAPGDGPMVIVIVGIDGPTVTGTSPPPLPAYLAAYDPCGNDGLGDPVLTTDPAGAVHFPGFAEAHACWTAVPANRPTRPDGKPNRPLTAATIEVTRDPTLPPGP